jgi:hypothetical protein
VTDVAVVVTRLHIVVPIGVFLRGWRLQAVQYSLQASSIAAKDPHNAGAENEPCGVLTGGCSPGALRPVGLAFFLLCAAFSATAAERASVTRTYLKIASGAW